MLSASGLLIWVSGPLVPDGSPLISARARQISTSTQVVCYFLLIVYRDIVVQSGLHARHISMLCASGLLIWVSGPLIPAGSPLSSACARQISASSLLFSSDCIPRHSSARRTTRPQGPDTFRCFRFAGFSFGYLAHWFRLAVR
eukprot:214930-Rhodomonas_salina.1